MSFISSFSTNVYFEVAVQITGHGFISQPAGVFCFDYFHDLGGGAFKNESVSFLHKELTLLDINSSNPFITIFPFQARFFSNDFCQNCRKFEASLFVPLEFFSFMFLLFSSLSPLFSFLFCFFIFLSWMLLQFFILKIKKNS